MGSVSHHHGAARNWWRYDLENRHKPETETRDGMNADEPITKDDIHAKLNELKGEVDTGVGDARSMAMTVGVIVIVVVVLAAFAMGRRRGKRLATVVEIRRI